MWVHEKSKKGGPWLIAIHGGGWRDPKYTEQSGIFQATALAGSFNGAASIEYRLAPTYKHPAQVDDAAAAIQELQTKYNIDSVVLIGHSAGAFIAGQLASHNSLDVPVRLVIGVEGIYDIVTLIDEYPDYKEMITDCFTEDKQVWKDANPDWAHLGAPFVAVHSKQDELLSLQQPRQAIAESKGMLEVLDNGLHFEVFEKIDLSPYVQTHIKNALQ